MTSGQLQGLLSRPVPLPAQEQRAGLLREANLLHACLLLKWRTLTNVYDFDCLLSMPELLLA